MRSGNTRTKPNSSYASNHASKAKTKEPADAGGKMTKFKNLDDIPDFFPDSMGVDDDFDNEYEHKSQHAYIHTQVQQRNSVESARNEDADLYGIHQGVAALKVSSAAPVGKAPPLPYDQLNSARGQAPKQVANQVPAPPNSKYFDYDNSAEDFDCDEQQPTGKGSAAGPSGAEFVPPLPYESSFAKGGSGQEDSIYFSKKPRPVTFKPYTLKQYKMTQPKEYVEISNIKPDLNSDELVAKRANLERIKEFSKNLQSFNRQTISQQPKLPPAAEKHDIAVSEQKFNSRRQKAIEFAKNVPKPRVAPSATNTNTNITTAASLSRPRQQRQTVAGGGDYDDSEYADRFGDIVARAGGGMHMGEEYAKESRIMELEAQHNNRKLQIEAMKKSMGLK